VRRGTTSRETRDVEMNEAARVTYLVGSAPCASHALRELTVLVGAALVLWPESHRVSVMFLPDGGALVAVIRGGRCGGRGMGRRLG
jgi:hypothetical protein